jgi:hypothetical protein
MRFGRGAQPFSLTVRIYWPSDAVLDGTYKLPPVTDIGGSTTVARALGNGSRAAARRAVTGDHRGSPRAG